MVRRHPELTAAELAALLPGRTVQAVKRQRSRIGRFPEQDAPRLCIRCDDRPVWAESAKARKWGLCKGCFVEEEERRISEEASAALVRQHRKRAGGGETDESDPRKGPAR